MHPYINIATQAARKAGNIILNGFDNLHKIKISEKSTNDYVTSVDRAVEKDLIQSIHKAYPKHAILGEEFGEQDENKSDTRWIIDPIDGTHNFMRGFPQFAISIAIEIKGVIEHGLVFDPFKQEIFSASKGRGAQLDGKRIRVSSCSNIKNSMIATSLHHNRDIETMNVYMQRLEKVAKSCMSIRMTGSAALDLAYVACGRLDGYYSTNLKIWDIAAAALFVQEAGGFVTDFNGGKEFLETGEIVASCPKVHTALLSSLKI